MATAAMPTCSEMRAPWMIWLRMSRPKLSVPNQCSALGPRSMDDVCSVGSNGASHGAKIATKTMSAMATSAAVPKGLLLASWPTV